MGQGQLVVRRSIHIAAPPERVWKELESFERMKRWFGVGHTLLKYEPRAGGIVELEVEHEGAVLRYGGPIVVFDPPRELTFDDDWIPSQGWEAPSLITIRLTPALDGTIVELLHHGFERTGAHAAETHRGFEGGWTLRQLDKLREVVEAS